MPPEEQGGGDPSDYAPAPKHYDPEKIDPEPSGPPRASWRFWVVLSEGDMPSSYELNVLAHVVAAMCHNAGDIRYGIDRLSEDKHGVGGGFTLGKTEEEGRA